MPVRTYEWQHIDPDTDIMGSMSGLEYCRRLISGEHPQSAVARMIGIELKSAEKGRVVVTLEAGEHLLHGRGIMHGGIISTLLDSAMAWAILSTLEQGRGFSTAHLSVDFLRAARAGALRAEAWVVSGGRRIALCQAEVRDEAGKLIACASSTCALGEVAPAPAS